MRLSQLGSLLFGRSPSGGTMLLHHHDAMLKPNPSRTVIRPFEPGYPSGYDHGRSRLQIIAERVTGFDDEQVEHLLSQVTSSLDGRHRNVNATFRRRFDDLRPMLADTDGIDAPRRELLGALFMEKYAFEAAALFNPSAVAHPDQEGVPDGSLRFVMSLQGIGEGHVSSVSFRTGIWTFGESVEVDPVGPTTQPPIIDAEAVHAEMPRLELHCGGSRVVSETMLFPVPPSAKESRMSVWCDLLRMTGRSPITAPTPPSTG